MSGLYLGVATFRVSYLELGVSGESQEYYNTKPKRAKTKKGKDKKKKNKTKKTTKSIRNPGLSVLPRPHPWKRRKVNKSQEQKA